MSTDVLLLLPIVLPLAAAAATMLVRQASRAQRTVSVGSVVLVLVVSIYLLRLIGEEGILVTQIGGRPAPFSITLVGDHLSVLMLIITGVIGLAGVIYSLADIDVERMHRGFHPLFQILMAGVGGCFLAGDLFNLYVWFEVLLSASFVLMALGSTPLQLEGSVKYVVLSLLASVLLLSGVGMIYGMTGTLNLADLAVRVANTEAPGLVTAISMVFVAGVGLKAAIFPFFFWLPASYHTPSVTVSAVFAGLLTKVGVYVLIRLFTLVFVQEVGYTHHVLLWISGATMITGVLGAAVQDEFRRILSFHIISQIGYMIMGLALLSPLALAGSVFFIVHNILAKTNLFFVSGIARRIRGSFELKRLGGLYRDYPFLSILFLIPALSLAGLPPFSGFWAKFILARAGLELESYAIVAAALVVGLLTLYSMSKIWLQAFLAPAQADAHDRAPAGARLLYVPVVFLGILTLAIGFHASPLIELAASAAEELMHTDRYINAVLNP